MTDYSKEAREALDKAAENMVVELIEQVMLLSKTKKSIPEVDMDLRIIALSHLKAALNPDKLPTSETGKTYADGLERAAVICREQLEEGYYPYEEPEELFTQCEKAIRAEKDKL